MVAGGPARTTPQTSDPSATLRSGRLEALRTKMGRAGRGAFLGLSMMSATQAGPQRPDTDTVRRDPVAELRADRLASTRYAQPSLSAPVMQDLGQNLRQGGDEEDIAGAESLENDVNDIAEEAAQAEEMSAVARARSQLKAKADQGMDQMMKKAQKEMQSMMQKAKTEGAAKFASAADEGEAFEIVDTLGTGVSVANVGLSIFQDAMNPTMKEMLSAQGLGDLKPSNALDIAIVAGTNMQVLKWSFVVVVLLPFCIVFIFLAYGSICNASLVCQTLGAGVASGLARFIGF